MRVKQLLNLPFNSENFDISASKLTSESFDHSLSSLWIANEDPHNDSLQIGITKR